ncbi:hypothetical protein PMIN06_009046 [Paraphaeosphaeria minitans]
MCRGYEVVKAQEVMTGHMVFGGWAVGCGLWAVVWCATPATPATGQRLGREYMEWIGAEWDLINWVMPGKPWVLGVFSGMQRPIQLDTPLLARNAGTGIAAVGRIWI